MECIKRECQPIPLDDLVCFDSEGNKLSDLANYSEGVRCGRVCNEIGFDHDHTPTEEFTKGKVRRSHESQYGAELRAILFRGREPCGPRILKKLFIVPNFRFHSFLFSRFSLIWSPVNTPLFYWPTRCNVTFVQNLGTWFWCLVDIILNVAIEYSRQSRKRYSPAVYPYRSRTLFFALYPYRTCSYSDSR